jgi:hypothetical protein
MFRSIPIYNQSNAIINTELLQKYNNHYANNDRLIFYNEMCKILSKYNLTRLDNDNMIYITSIFDKLYTKYSIKWNVGIHDFIQHCILLAYIDITVNEEGNILIKLINYDNLTRIDKNIILYENNNNNIPFNKAQFEILCNIVKNVFTDKKLFLKNNNIWVPPNPVPFSFITTVCNDNEFNYLYQILIIDVNNYLISHNTFYKLYSSLEDKTLKLIKLNKTLNAVNDTLNEFIDNTKTKEKYDLIEKQELYKTIKYIKTDLNEGCIDIKQQLLEINKNAIISLNYNTKHENDIILCLENIVKHETEIIKHDKKFPEIQSIFNKIDEDINEMNDAISEIDKDINDVMRDIQVIKCENNYIIKAINICIIWLIIISLTIITIIMLYLFRLLKI